MNKSHFAGLPPADPACPLFEDDRAYIAKIVEEHGSDEYSDIGVMFFDLRGKIDGIVEMRKALAGDGFDSRRYHRALYQYALDLDEIMDGARPVEPPEPKSHRPRATTPPRRFNA